MMLDAILSQPPTGKPQDCDTHNLPACLGQYGKNRLHRRVEIDIHFDLV
jgi:hypothetical protein